MNGWEYGWADQQRDIQIDRFSEGELDGQTNGQTDLLSNGEVLEQHILDNNT